MAIEMLADGRFVLNEIFLGSVYDVDGLDFSKIRNVLDLGANVGTFAIYVCSRAPQATLHCFEPSKVNFDRLHANLTTNSAPAKAHRYAISTEPGTATLDTGGASVEYALASGNDGAPSVNSESVECIHLAGIFALTKVDHFDFVKSDIEGIEREIINACPDELLLRMGAITIEWHHGLPELETIAGRLRDLGFEAKPVSIDGCYYLKAMKRKN